MLRNKTSKWVAHAAILVYRRLLHFYPSEFRLSYGSGMERMFREELGEARGRSPVGAVALLLAREVWGVLLTAPPQWYARLRAWKPTDGRRRRSLVIVLNVVLGDVRCAVRSFVRYPGFALTVIAQLGLGIGATTTILSVVDNVLLRPLPYPNADELVVFSNPGHSYALYSDWRDRTTVFTAVAAVWSDGRGFGLSGNGAPESLPGARVTSDFFKIFGATALHGRLLIDSDFAAVTPGVAVISYALWRRHWGGAWGKDLTLTVDGSPTEVVGVLDPAFQIPEELVDSGVEVWLPLGLPLEIAHARTWNTLRVVARRHASLSPDAAQADVDALSAVLAEEYPATDRLTDGSPRLYRLTSLYEAMVGDVAQLLYTLLGAVGMMLLIACANVANLFLARETGRTREMALRAALGAGRGRIVAQVLSESLLLALVSGVCGVLLAFVGIQVFEMLHPGGFPRMQHIAVNPRVLFSAVLASLAAASVFAIAPAIAASRSAVGAALKTTELGATAPRNPMSIRKMMVVAELATGLILLVGASLLFHSFLRLRNVDGGFSPNNVLVMPLNLGARFSDEDRLEFARELLDRIESIPGVEVVGAGSTLPPYRQGRCCWFQAVRPAETDEDPMFTMLHPVTPGYFDVLGATILRGRGFTRADNEPGFTPTVINEALARTLFGENEPLGKSILVDGNHWTVVGVVNDIRHWGYSRESGSNAYVPHAVFGGPFISLQVGVKSQLEPALLSGEMRDAVWATDATMPIREINQLRYNVASSVAEPRFLSILMATFAAFAVSLAAGGIYAFFTFVGRQHRRELGIRLALGATPNGLARTVLKGVLMLTLLGTALGLAGAFALSRLLRSLLYGIKPTDPVAFVGAASALMLVALVASYLPAHRASKTDPIATLRAE